MKEIAVFGLGSLGKTLAITYSDLGGKVIAIDYSQEKIDEIADHVTYALKADLSEEKVIKELGVSGVDIAIVTIGDSFQTSIIVTAVCKEMGIPYIIAKATDTLQANILTKVGADEIIYPEVEMGKKIAKSIAGNNSFINIAKISEKFKIVECNVPSRWIGKNLIELDLRKKYGFNIIAIKNGEEFDISPDINIPLNKDTQLVVLGEAKQLEKVLDK